MYKGFHMPKQQVTLSDGGKLALTQAELDYLQQFLDAGDGDKRGRDKRIKGVRALFYMNILRSK